MTALSATRVVNIRHHKCDVYIGRARPSFKVEGCDGYFGNPYAVEPHGREVAISLFKAYFTRRIKIDPVFRLRVLALRGKTLGCFCKPQDCHGDVIVEWIEAQPIEDLAA